MTSETGRRHPEERSPEEIEDLLRRIPAPEPPEGLLARLQADLPADLRPPAPAPGHDAPPPLAGVQDARVQEPPPSLARVIAFPLASRIGLAGSLVAHAAVIALALLGGWWLRGSVVPAPPALDASARRGGAAVEHAAGYLRAGYLPPPATVDPGAFVRGLDYGDLAPRDRDVALVAEGGPTPFLPGPDWRLLRVGMRAREDAARPVLARQAVANVDFTPDLVLDHRAVGDAPLAGDGTVRPGDAASALYEVRLQPAAPNEVVARVRLDYRRDADGVTARETREVRVKDIAGSWEGASPSLRLAALAAEFAEVLAEGDAEQKTLDDLARRAQRLVGEMPGGSSAPEFVMLTAVAVHATPTPRTPDATIFAVGEPVPRVTVEAATEPVLVQRVDPVVPAAARARGAHGTVLLRATVDATGRVTAVDVLRSVPGLDEPAIDAVRRWTYRPGLLGGQPITTQVTVSLTFL